MSAISALLGYRAQENGDRYIAKPVGTPGTQTVTTSIALQESVLEQREEDHVLSVSASAVPSPFSSVPTCVWQCDRDVMEPYIIRLRTTSELDLSVSDHLSRDRKRRDATTAAVAPTYVGSTSASQRPAVYQNA